MAGAHCLAGRKRVGHAEVVGDIAVGVAPGGMMVTLLRRQAALGISNARFRPMPRPRRVLDSFGAPLSINCGPFDRGSVRVS